MTEETKAADGAPAGVSDSTQLLGSRRLKVLPINRRAMLELITGKARAILPEGATAEDVMYDWESDCFLVKLRHDSFDEIGFGYIIPRMHDVVCEKVESKPNVKSTGVPPTDAT